MILLWTVEHSSHESLRLNAAPRLISLVSLRSAVFSSVFSSNSFRLWLCGEFAADPCACLFSFAAAFLFARSCLKIIHNGYLFGLRTCLFLDIRFFFILFVFLRTTNSHALSVERARTRLLSKWNALLW